MLNRLQVLSQFSFEVSHCLRQYDKTGHPPSYVDTRALRRPRRVAAVILWAQPPPTFGDRRAAADNLSARHRCDVGVFITFCHFSMTKKRKRSSDNFEDTTKFFSGSLKFFGGCPRHAAADVLDRRRLAPPNRTATMT